MALDPKSDMWVPACDLCGSFRSETIKLGPGGEARRCGDCGLVRVIHANGHRTGGYAAVRLPEELLLGAVSHVRNEGARSALVIGTPSTALVEAAAEAG